MKKIEKILKHLDNVNRRGENQWSARCPAHEDHRNSLSIRYDQETKRILYYCFAGCTYYDIKTAITALMRKKAVK